MYEGTSAEKSILVKVDLESETYKAKFPKMPKGYFYSFLNDFGNYFAEQHTEIYKKLI